jgi:hypothetical protein
VAFLLSPWTVCRRNFPNTRQFLSQSAIRTSHSGPHFHVFHRSEHAWNANNPWLERKNAAFRHL